VIKKKTQEKHLDQQNAKILNTIIEISKRKKHFWMNNSDKYWSFPVSLNINVRKEKSEEIYRENRKIAETLSKCKASSDYATDKLILESETQKKLKTMITKQNKLKQIKRQIETISKGGNITGSQKFSRMQDIVTDGLTRLKNVNLRSINEKTSDVFNKSRVVRLLKQAIGLDSKIVDFLIEIYELSKVFEEEGIPYQRFEELLERSQ